MREKLHIFCLLIHMAYCNGALLSSIDILLEVKFMLFREFFSAVNFKIHLLPCNILKLVCITFGNVRIFMKRDRWKRNNSWHFIPESTGGWRRKCYLKLLTSRCLSFIMLVSKPNFLCFSIFRMFWTVQEWMASSSCFLLGDLQSHRSCSMRLGRLSATRWKLSFHR